MRDGRTRDGRPTCFRCGKVGHLAANCIVRLPPRQVGQNSPTQNNSRIAVLDTVSYPEASIVTGTNAEYIMPDTTTIDVDETEYIFDEPIEVSCVGSPLREVHTTRLDSSENLPPEPVLITDDGTYALPHDLSIQGEAAGLTVQFLIDTGAAISVVSAEFLHRTPLGSTFPLEPGKLHAVKTVSGEQLPVQGKVTLPLIIENAQYSCEAHVIENLGYDFVLGRDFLRQNNAVIDLGGDTLRLQKDDSPSPPVLDSTCQVRVQSTCVVPPYSEVLVPAKLETSFAHKTGLIEPNVRLGERYNLQGAAVLTVVSPSNLVPFRILNPTSQPVTLYRETNLGTFQDLDHDVATVSLDQGPPSPPNPPPTPPDEIPINWGDSPLSAAQRSQLQSLLNAYRDIFAFKPEELGRTGIVQHHIDTGNEPPIRLRPYRVAHTQRDKIASHVQDMLDRNIIQPSVSPWAAPVVLVRKNDGQDRFCVDYRRLNQITKKDSYPLPRIDDTLDALSGVKFFSTLDLLSGYWQLEMDPSSREKTAFTTHCGLFEFLVMPFGLTNAPSTVQRVMECVLQGLNWKICLVYLDDVIIFSPSFDSHLEHLPLVFQRFREANIKLKPSKCRFAHTKVNYLGHVVSREGVSPDPAKIKAVEEFPVPKKVRDVRAFLGLSGYYRKFVRDFSLIAAPLHDLTKKNVPFAWTDACQASFLQLKEALLTAPILAFPDFHLRFHLYVDASNEGIGMILGQIQNNKEVVIAYAGRKLNPAERNYSATEREALAVVAGIKYFQPYLHGRPFTVHSDHHALRWLMNVKDPTGRLARWSLYLQQHDFDIQYRAGKKNANADGLSRRPYIAALDLPGLQTAKIFDMQRKDPDLMDLISYLEDEILPQDNRIARATLRVIDDYYLDDNGLLCHLWTPTGRGRSGIQPQLVIPSALRHEILTLGHNDVTAGHMGTFKTYEKLRLRYYWRGMFNDVQHWCRTCVHCAMKKRPRATNKAPLLPIPVENAFDRVGVDCVGPLPVSKSGNRYIVVFSDYLTKWPEAFAVPTIDAVVIAKLFVHEIIGRHGAPRTLLSDRGQNFLSKLLKEICRLVNTEKVYTTSYHPQTDGLVERLNGTLVQSLSQYVSTDQKDWDEHLQSVLLAYRVSPSEVTGDSPFFLLYGREPRLPMDVSLIPARDLSSSVAEHRARVVEHLETAQELARANIQRAQQRMKLQYDQHSNFPEYDLGQKVWVYSPKTKKGLSKKLRHLWHGPMRIYKKLSPVTYKVKLPSNSRIATTIHINRMKPYYDPADRPISPPEEDDPTEPYLHENELPEDSFEPPVSPATPPLPPPTVETVTIPMETSDEPTSSECSSSDTLPDSSTAPEVSPSSAEDNADTYQVERILKQRVRGGKTQFYIKWHGYSSRHNTWEPEENILDPQLVEAFYARRAGKVKDSTQPPQSSDGVATLSSYSKSSSPSLSRAVYGTSQLMLFSFVVCIALALLSASVVDSQAYDSSNQRVSYYPESLMISRNSKALIFFQETNLVNVHAELPATVNARLEYVNNTCSSSQNTFYNNILHSYRVIQGVLKRLSSLQGVTNLIECDKYLRRFYRYSTGLTPKMICPRAYHSSLMECKSWALNHCSRLSHAERAWLRHRTRRSWMCHAGVFGLFRALYEASGKSCEPNHVSNLKESLRDVYANLGTLRNMIKVVNGKTVVLIKATDELHSKVASLSTYVGKMAKYLENWRDTFNLQFQKYDCTSTMHYEFTSKHSHQLVRTLVGILRLFEFQDVIKQASELQNRELVGYSSFPGFMIADITARLSRLPSLALTTKALTTGFPLFIEPLVDFSFPKPDQLSLNILFTVPEVPNENSFCTLEYVTPIKYNISGTCYTGPITRHDLALVTCPNNRFLLPTVSLEKCFHDDSTYLCPQSVLALVNTTSWLGMPWTPASKLSFLRTHKKASDCSDLNDLYHLGGRFYLATNTRTLTITKGKNTSTILLSPLMVYHFPCDIKFANQRTGLGDCPRSLTIDIPIFTGSTIHYVPWQNLVDDETTPQLHFESLKITPLQKFNKSTLDALDKTFESLDNTVDKQLDKLDSDISLIKETSTTTINDVLTYVAFFMAFANLCILIFFGCRSRCPCSPCTAHSPVKTTTSATEHIPLDNLPKCEDCDRPRCSSV